MEQNDLEIHVFETYASLGILICRNHWMKLNKWLDLPKEQNAQLKKY